MPATRAIVVASGVTARRSLSGAVGNAGFEVAAASPDLRTALARVQQFQPAAVFVDSDVVLDGLADLRRVSPTAAIYAFGGLDPLRDEIVRGVGGNVLSSAAEIPTRSGAPVAANQGGRPIPAPPPARRAHSGPIEVVGIGASTGGPAALAVLLKGLPAAFPVPVLITQHMPANFTKVLATRLDSTSGMRVREAQGGEHPEPGEVWLAPGDRHLVLVKEGDTLTLRLTQDPPECFCRPSVDVMFRSLASTLGGATLGVILTGMGQDGLRGSTLLKETGATILAQDEATSVVWGMPGYVTRGGIASRVLPIDQIVGEIIARVSIGRNAAAMSMRRELGRAS